jgi:hypothetical protein
LILSSHITAPDLVHMGRVDEGHRGPFAVALYVPGDGVRTDEKEDRVADDQSVGAKGAQTQAEKGKGTGFAL